MKERNAVQKRIIAMSGVAKQEQSNAIIKQLIPLLEEYDTIGMYLATANEVDLQPLIHKFIDKKIIAIPKCVANHQMVFYHLLAHTQLECNGFGIQEPRQATKVAKAQLQVLLVPLVGFDEQCHRIGHGAGYYDRYLADMDVLKIGVAFEEQKCSILTMQSHDVNMDMVVTATQIYTAK